MTSEVKKHVWIWADSSFSRSDFSSFGLRAIWFFSPEIAIGRFLCWDFSQLGFFVLEFRLISTLTRYRSGSSCSFTAGLFPQLKAEWHEKNENAFVCLCDADERTCLIELDQRFSGVGHPNISLVFWNIWLRFCKTREGLFYEGNSFSFDCR